MCDLDRHPDDAITLEALHKRLAALETQLRDRNNAIHELAREKQALEALNGALRSQNGQFRSAARTLTTELKDAWWRRANNAYERLLVAIDDDPDTWAVTEESW